MTDWAPLNEKVLPAMASSYRNLLKNIGEDPTREGLLDTPMRSTNNKNGQVRS